jgi:hypothetical protein
MGSPRRHRDIEKKQTEVTWAQPIALEMNQRDIMDFEVIPASDRDEPADVLFVSKSNRLRQRKVQVVTAPRGDFLHLRPDNHNLERFGDLLRASLVEAGVPGASIEISAGPQIVLHGARPSDIDSVRALIVEMVASGTQMVTSTNSDHLNKYSLSNVVDVVSVTLWPDCAEIDILLENTLGGAVDTDSSWLDEAVEAKATKYGDAQATRDITLVIGASRFVGQEQVAAFREKHPDPSQLPFEEVWLATEFYGIFQLK